MKRSYDVENRTVSYASSSLGSDPSVPEECDVGTGAIEVSESDQWGPDGHPQQVVDGYLDGKSVDAINGLSVSESLHWDGDSLLFSAFSDSNSDSGANGYHAPTPGMDRIFIGNFAVYNVSTSPLASYGLQLVARDETGLVLPWANGSYNVMFQGCFPGIQPSANVPPFDLNICETRTDGYTLGSSTVQGVRAFDSDSQGWTTPDAYSGDVSDPMSQQRYVWNNDSPLQYSDPSGYVPCTGPNGTCTTSDLQKTLASPPDAVAICSGCLEQPRGQVQAAALGTGPVYLYYAEQTSSGKPYWGITNDFARRSIEQLKNGRVLVEFYRFSSRLAARGGEQTAINASGLGNLENVRNSIAPGSAAWDEAMAAAEDDSPGILESIGSTAAELLQAGGEILPP